MTQDSFQPSQPQPHQLQFEENTISLMDIILVLVRHLKLIIIVPSIFCIGTIIYELYFTSPLYVSTATFMSSGGSSKQSTVMGLASQFGFAIPSSKTAEWSYLDIIKSRTLARNMLNRQFDTEKYGSQKTLLQILTYGDKEPTVGIDTLFKHGIQAAQSMIEVSMSGNMYELEISAFEPQFAADMAAAVMDELDRYQREYNAKNTTETRQFIEDRLTDIIIELEAAEDALKVFRERNRRILESPQLQMEQERLARDVAVNIGVFTTLKQQLETAKIEEVKELDYVLILDQPETPLSPSKPKKKLMVILAGLLGIGLGILLAFIKDNAINSDEEEQKKMKKAKSLLIKNIANFLPKRFK